MPVTYSYNLTIDRQLKWGTMLEVAYVGSRSGELMAGGQTLTGSAYAALSDQNKTPVGALFLADPVTGLVAVNPEVVSSTCAGAVCNSLSDYHPYGYAYGTNSVYLDQMKGYANYNGLQASWLKKSGRLNFNFNVSWAKELDTGLQQNPFVIRANYGPGQIDRPLVFNSSYRYQLGNVYHGNPLLKSALNGWMITGITTWQAGQNLVALMTNESFHLSESYINIPAAVATSGVTTAITSATNFGTDSALPNLPVLTCNPTHGLAKYERVNISCFAPPALHAQGGQNFPYMSMSAFLNNDLAIQKAFPIHESQSVEFRASAFNWLNHPLPEFSSNKQLSLYYSVDYTSQAATLNTGSGGTVSNFGYEDTKTGAPFERIFELDLKYKF
jgi:hypothetical protein